MHSSYPTAQLSFRQILDATSSKKNIYSSYQFIAALENFCKLLS